MAEKETKDTIAEIEEKIKAMKKDKEAKCKAAKQQLLDMLGVTAEKYRTATGTMEALRALRFVDPDCKDVLTANILAHDMASVVLAMVTKASELEYSKMDQLCEGFYDPFYTTPDVNGGRTERDDLAFELMRIDLCRNVSDGAEDMVSFINRTQEEIDSMGAELKKLKEESNGK